MTPSWLQFSQRVRRRMGQSLKKLASGIDEERKEKEIGPLIESYYDKYFEEDDKEWTSAEFYHAVCEIVEEMNKKLGSSQFRVPTTKTLDEAYHNHGQQGNGKKLSMEEFQKMVQEVIFHTGFSGVGAKDLLFYIFGVPAAALFLKQRIFPRALPNEVFIPALTSATVLVLAKLNKI